MLAVGFTATQAEPTLPITFGLTEAEELTLVADKSGTSPDSQPFSPDSVTIVDGDLIATFTYEARITLEGFELSYQDSLLTTVEAEDLPGFLYHYVIEARIGNGVELEIVEATHKKVWMGYTYAEAHPESGGYAYFNPLYHIFVPPAHLAGCNRLSKTNGEPMTCVEPGWTPPE